jgi:hypothetical protein
MTSILRLRARRFHALYAMLTGETGSVPRKHSDLSDHLSRDVGLPEGRPHERAISHLGIYVFPGRPWRPSSKEGSMI